MILSSRCPGGIHLGTETISPSARIRITHHYTWVPQYGLLNAGKSNVTSIGFATNWPTPGTSLQPGVGGPPLRAGHQVDPRAHWSRSKSFQFSGFCRSFICSLISRKNLSCSVSAGCPFSTCTPRTRARTSAAPARGRDHIYRNLNPNCPLRRFEPSMTSSRLPVPDGRRGGPLDAEAMSKLQLTSSKILWNECATSRLVASRIGLTWPPSTSWPPRYGHYRMTRDLSLPWPRT